MEEPGASKSDTYLGDEEAALGRVTDGDGLPACEGTGGGSGLCDREEENSILPFASLSDELFQISPICRLPVSASGGPPCSRSEAGPEKGVGLPLALPPPPPRVSADLRAALEQVEDAYKGIEIAPGDHGCLSKGEVSDILTQVENFMGSQACDTARMLGVSSDGVDKGLKNSMLLIKRRWLADVARKAKADVAGKFKNEGS